MTTSAPPKSVPGASAGSPVAEDPDPHAEAPVLENRNTSPEGKYRRAIFAVPVDVVVAVGHARPAIGELLAMRRDMVLPLTSRMDDPVEIRIGDRVIARGELEEIAEDGSGRLGVRLTEVVDVSNLF